MIHSIPGSSRNIGLVSALYMLSAALNAGVTSLIVAKLLQSRRQVTRLMNVPDNQLYTGVIGLLVESALPFSTVAIIAAVLNLPGIQQPASIYFGTLWAIMAVSSSTVCRQHQLTVGRISVILPAVDHIPCSQR